MTQKLSPQLEAKIDYLMKKRSAVTLGTIDFSSPLLLAPMASICHAPFRLLMQRLGSGGSVSELISCHGINYKNDRTLSMLRIHPEEKNVGIQIFGEDGEKMAQSIEIIEEFKPNFIDINMGCPVKKVVAKGGGSALLKDPKALASFLRPIKKRLNVPLTIKIRTGWDENSINAYDIIDIARDEGVEFVAIHGRTRTQGYSGKANWELIEQIASISPLPVIGNGDLHTPKRTYDRMVKTRCEALMLARGPIRNPFIFLESLDVNHEIFFTPQDIFETMVMLKSLMEEHFDREKVVMVQMRNHIMWATSGYSCTAKFRDSLFKTENIDQIMNVSGDFFHELKSEHKKINEDEIFMSSGHG